MKREKGKILLPRLVKGKGKNEERWIQKKF